MNPGTIWWSQIGNSLHFLNKTTEQLRACRSAVLELHSGLPWRKEFYDALDLRRTGFGAVRRLVRIPWDAGAEPGAFILEELCSARVRAEYWPGQGCGTFLGSRDDLMLNDYYVWITGIDRREDLIKWSCFIEEYTAASGSAQPRAVFILEYSGAAMEVAGLERIVYGIESCDCRIFCLEAAAALKDNGLRDYQAEMALQIGGRDPEFCAALLQQGEQLLRDPVGTAFAVGIAGRGRFAQQPEQEIVSAAWKAAVVIFFPILEQQRLAFIAKYKDALNRCLPISDSNGERISDPYDLEIRMLCRSIGVSAQHFAPEDVERIRLCRTSRNQLAHNRMLPYEDALRLLRS